MLLFSFSLFCFIVGFLSAPWAGLELMAAALLQPFDCYRCDQPCPAFLSNAGFFLMFPWLMVFFFFLVFLKMKLADRNVYGAN